MKRVFCWSVLLIATLSPLSSADDNHHGIPETQFRLWTGSPYLTHDSFEEIKRVLGEAGFDITDNTPRPLDPNKPPLTQIVPGADGRYQEVYPYGPVNLSNAIIRSSRDQGLDPNKPPLTQIVPGADGRYQERYPYALRNNAGDVSGRDGFYRRNGVVNGYAYRAKQLGLTQNEYYQQLQATRPVDFDVISLNNGNALYVPKGVLLTPIEAHTFHAAPQTDAAVIVNHVFRSVLQAAEKIPADVLVHYSPKRKTVYFEVRFL